MKAISIEKPGTVVVKEVEKPVPGEGEALLRVLYGGICGSDLGSYRGTFAYVSYPRKPGHEFSAEIVEVGENDRGLRPGMIVVCNPYFNCSQCYSCERRLYNACQHNETMGVQREGAFSQYITMPVERIYDGQGLDPKLLALIEPFCISYHGVKRARVQKGDRVLIVGAGTIGVLAAVSAKKLGAHVTIADIAGQKLAYAKEFGVDETMLYTTKEEFDEDVSRATGGRGYDVTIEAVGLPSTFQNCIDAASYGGSVVLIGVGKENLDFNFTVIQKKELNIFGSRNALQTDFHEAIEMVRGGQVPLEKVVSATYRFEEAVRAFEELDSKSGELLKMLIDFT